MEFPFVNGGKAQARHLDRWTLETPNAEYPITHINQWHNYEASSFNVRDASYFRLKNVQVGYNLSTAVLETLGVSKLRLYVSAENLFTISKFSKDFDPESPDNAWTNYTPVKIFSGGIVINL
ncbi:hypothetical protein ACU8V7_02915 [Zobellia nedashkovskayae]